MNRKISAVLAVIGILLAGHFLAYKMFAIPSQIELVGLLGLALFLPVLRFPIVGIYAVFLVSPFVPYIRRLYYLVADRPELDPLIVTSELILGIILISLYFEFKEQRDRLKNVRLYTGIIIFYFIFVTLRVFVFNFIPRAESIARYKFYGPPVLIFFIGILFAGQLKHLKAIWGITIAGGTLAALYGFKQLYLGYSASERIWFTSIRFTTLFIEGIVRPFSFLKAPVAFADYIQLALIAILMWWQWGAKTSKIFIIAATPLLINAILITSVRSSWIGVMATAAFWFFFVNIRGARKRIAVLVTVCLAYVALDWLSGMLGSGGLDIGSTMSMMGGQFQKQEYMELLVANRTSAISNPFEEYSFMSRITLWREILMLSSDPIMALMGRGTGAFKADSLYFTYLAEFGYPGLFLMIFILVLFILKGLEMIDHAPGREYAVLAKGITVMNLVFALVSITGTHIHNFPGDYYFWFWNGVLIGIAAFVGKPGEYQQALVQQPS
ncbi:MAG: hypothetical protein GF398_13490 [Chitinivibrionales bacterium]|nr:hypothetical protein [Chitinivibrionales bacterium]